MSRSTCRSNTNVTNNCSKITIAINLVGVQVFYEKNNNQTFVIWSLACL